MRTFKEILTEAEKWKTGTPVFMVPIRHWENPEPDTGHVADHKTLDGAPLPNPTGPNPHGMRHVYVHHDGYGHNVYVDRSRTFLSHGEALNAAHKATAEKKKAEKKDADRVMKKIMDNWKSKRKP